MATCRTCGSEFQWGRVDGTWVPLEPVTTHDGMDRTYVDENGVLRADHRDRHSGGASVNAIRLDVKVPADKAAEVEQAEVGPVASVKRRMKRKAG